MALLLIPMSIFAQKFGHFNSADIIQAMPEYTTVQNEIQQLQTQYENDLKRMQDELQRKYADFQNKPAQTTGWSPSNNIPYIKFQEIRS